jgi:diaminohydroxyphosphoribosylaminopyrimidine deaminase / 5-amino-6-(5-phosphoribosylamino)uracil reductase
MLTDIQGMKRALELAQKGQGFVSPNPMVGCVIAEADGRIIGEGFHKKFGGAHAEVEALNAVAESDKYLLRGATVYVNLEPCSHFGQTPACANTLIQAQIKRVVVGMIDPNPKVSGNGIGLLREAGIEVVVGVLEQECRWLNRAFIKFITTGLPYIILKSAQAVDGCIATMHGQSKWITSEDFGGANNCF